jgi:hypothetical protein
MQGESTHFGDVIYCPKCNRQKQIKSEGRRTSTRSQSPRDVICDDCLEVEERDIVYAMMNGTMIVIKS